MKRSLVIVSVIIAILLGGQGQALAADFARPFEDDIAAYTFEENGERCITVTVGPFGQAAKGCFTRYGDIWRIQDSLFNGDETFIYWENWLLDGTTWRPYRHGECNNNLDSPNWGQCNKDLYESSSVNYYGSKGSRVRFQVCNRDILGNRCNPSDISQAPWINNNA
ncbi:hypothetical protein ACQEVC_05600 [Plantactinospora sp. CA-294935]|uniref:hypothetical protein n=1 Tax=Plantactinospora sp. CA-294935 TaxID=3240012 RepID=UPI003D92B0A2